MENGKWKTENGKRKMENQMENGKWKMDNKEIRKTFFTFHFPFSVLYECLADYFKARAVR